MASHRRQVNINVVIGPMDGTGLYQYIPQPNNPKDLDPPTYTYEYLTSEDGGLPKHAACLKNIFDSVICWHFTALCFHKR